MDELKNLRRTADRVASGMERQAAVCAKKLAALSSAADEGLARLAAVLAANPIVANQPPCQHKNTSTIREQEG